MNHTSLDLLLAAGCIATALAVGARCGLGLLVWLAGELDARRGERRREPKPALRTG